jgi:hypothetical protein
MGGHVPAFGVHVGKATGRSQETAKQTRMGLLPANTDRTPEISPPKYEYQSDISVWMWVSRLVPNTMLISSFSSPFLFYIFIPCYECPRPSDDMKVPLQRGFR